VRSRYAVVLVIIALLSAAGCGGDSGTNPSPSAEVIKYTVTSTFGTALLITYVTNTTNGGSAQQTVTNAELPWTFSFTPSAPGQAVQVDAYVGFPAPVTTTITVSIYKNDVLIKSATSTGVGAVAIASSTS
jgi:hypothetical protein